MSSPTGHPTTRFSRTPLREVNNEISAVELHSPSGVKTPSSKNKNTAHDENLSPASDQTGVVLVMKAPHICRTEVSADQENVIFRSFVCTGGDVELSEMSVLSEESALIGALKLDDAPQTVNDVSIYEEGAETVFFDTMHEDHPYCCNPSADPYSVCTVNQDRHELEKNGIVHENLSTSYPVGEQADITFRSFTCPGGEIQIADGSVVQDECDLDKNAILGDYSQCYENKSETSDEHTELPLSPRDHADHPYCNNEKKTSVSGTYSEILNASQGNVESVAASDCKTAGHIQIAPSQQAEEHVDITFKSVCFSGAEIEIDNSYRMSEMSMVLKHLPEDGNHQSVFACSVTECDGKSGFLLTPDSQHADHPYCQNEYDLCGADESNAPFPGAAIICENEASSRSQLASDCLLERSKPAVTNVVFPEGADSSQAVNSDICSEVEMVASEKSLVPDELLPDELLPSRHHHSFHNGENEAERSKCLNDVFQRFSSDHEEDAGRNAEPTQDNFSSNFVIPGPDPQKSTSINTEAVSDGAEIVEQLPPLQPYAAVSSAVDVSPVNFREESEIIDARNAQNIDMVTSNASDSALGLSGERALSDVEVPRAESPHQWLCNAVSLQTQLKLCSALTVPDPSTPKNVSLSRSVLQGHTEVNLENLWPELPDSPIPPPQLNSTAVHPIRTPALPPKDREERPVGLKDGALLNLSAIGKGPLQQQLRQMAELLIQASGKINAPASPAAVRRCSAAVTTTPVQRHSACVCTTPVLLVDHSANTSGQVEDLKEVSVTDACTSTDSLLWSVKPSSMESLSRSELEQKLLTTLIMAEVLSQQLASTQTHGPRTGPAPSDLRDRLVQTEHTQLSPIGPYRELYVRALEKIQTLEEDGETLQDLHHAVQLMRTTMITVKTGTEEALNTMRQIEAVVNDDQEILSKQVNAMKTLYVRCIETLRKMEQKTKMCLQERDNMRMKVDESLQERDRVLRVLDQLRVHHADQVSELQQRLGSHQELTAALSQTCPQLAEMNRSYVESLTAATSLLKDKLDDHTRLAAELHKSQQLLRRMNPVLQKLQQRASAAIEESKVHQAERDRAVTDRAQMVCEIEQAHSSLQDASQQIADLNTQITIMNSEMMVLREQLGEAEQERDDLQRKSTELSATVSSSLASYAFLEQALASETTKLQCSLHETQKATERADSLQATLEDSQRQVKELEDALSQRDALLTELHAETEAQRLQLRRLSQVQTELSGAREMNDFLQAENELTREQLGECEGLLRSNLQGLRERNLECEDLRLALQQLRNERDSLQDEREKARGMLLEQGEQMAQATLDISLLQHRLRCLTSSTLAVCTATSAKSSESASQEDRPPQAHPTPRQPCTSFVNSVMLALTEEQESTEPPAELAGEQNISDEAIGGRNSMFSKLSPAAPQHAEGEPCSVTLVELLSSLSEYVSELHSAIEQLKLHRDSEVQSLQKDICGLQEALQAESDRHREEEAELRQQVSRLKSQAEKDSQVLQQKIQDERVLKKVCSELEESMEEAQKHRAENSELRREGTDLRLALQQSQVEVQALREELTQSGAQSAAGTRDLDERIRLRREVEKMKASLKEVEESRAKLLERAKRHQMVHAMNQRKLERELHLLDNMIESVRKTLSSIPEVVSSCPELQKLVEFLE